MDRLPHEPNGKRRPRGLMSLEVNDVIVFFAVHVITNLTLSFDRCLILLALLFKFIVFVAPAGYDDGSSPSDHCSAAQGGQHQ